MSNIKEVIPEQEKGAKTNVQHAVEKGNEQEASDFFKLVKGRLQDVNNWHSFAGPLSARFSLIDANGPTR